MSFEAMSWAVKQRLPATQKIVLLMLADRINKDTGTCHPSVTRLAEDCGLSERAARNALRDLEVAGVIETKRRSEDGVSLPNIYSITGAFSAGVGHQMPGGGAPGAGGGGAPGADKPVIKQPVIKPIVGDQSPTAKCPHQEIVALYNKILPELQAVIPERWDGTRAKYLQARWRESPKHQTLEFWERFFTVLRNYPWYLGDNDRGWRANLGWIVVKKNFDNLIEKFVTDSRRSAAA